MGATHAPDWLPTLHLPSAHQALPTHGPRGWVRSTANRYLPPSCEGGRTLILVLDLRIRYLVF